MEAVLTAILSYQQNESKRVCVFEMCISSKGLVGESSMLLACPMSKSKLLKEKGNKSMKYRNKNEGKISYGKEKENRAQGKRRKNSEEHE